MRKIFLISYGDSDYDGRLRSLIYVFEKLGTVHLFSRGSKVLSKEGQLCNDIYIRFIGNAVRYARKLGQLDILVLDNRKATIPGFIIRKINKPQKTILDCRELYLLKETKNFSGKIGCIFERRMAQTADIVICANRERAEIMQKEYALCNTPLVYENLRKLEYSSAEGYEEAKAKIDSFIGEDDEIRVISSSGCSISRTNDVLVKNLKKVEGKCRLFLVGNYNDKEKRIIESLAKKDSINKVVILNQLNQDELKYLISKCHIGIVNYGQYDTNNRLCASGKLYEFIYEGKPVVTTTNPPLRRLCQEENIGIADDQYADGINRIMKEYKSYCDCVNLFAQTHTVNDNDFNLINSIKDAVEEK